MAFSEPEAKVIAALEISDSELMIRDICGMTGLSVQLVHQILCRCSYEGQVTDLRTGWRITSRGRASISAPGYKEILSGIQFPAESGS